MGQDCKFCGAYIAGSATKCPACGKRIGYKEPERRSYDPERGGSASAAQTAPQEENRAYTYKDEFKQRYGSSGADRRTDYAKASAERGMDTERGFPEEEYDVVKNRGISYLSYFGILFLIPYLVRPDSEFAKFHANQGLILFLADVIVSILGGLIGTIGGIACLVLFVTGLVNVYRGDMKELPIIGKFRLLK